MTLRRVALLLLALGCGSDPLDCEDGYYAAWDGVGEEIVCRKAEKITLEEPDGYVWSVTQSDPRCHLLTTNPRTVWCER